MLDQFKPVTGLRFAITECIITREGLLKIKNNNLQGKYEKHCKKVTRIRKFW